MAQRRISDLNASVWGFVAFTGISFGAGGLLVKKLTNDGIDAFTVTWVPFLFGGLIALIHGMITKDYGGLRFLQAFFWDCLVRLAHR